MGGIKDILEPGCLVLLFMAGTLINYRPSPSNQPHESDPLLGSRSTTPDPEREERWWHRLFPDNTRFRNNIPSRFLNHFPFLIEIIYWNLVYWIYQLSRAITAIKIRSNDSVFDKSREHALSILSFEQNLHISIEQPLQAWVLKHTPSLMNLCAIIYYSHIVASVAFAVYTYTYLPRPHYQYIRRSMAACNILAFVILSIYRVMPPRMLPSHYGFHDILHPSNSNSGSSWTNNRFQLTIAAMPSLHFGISALIAYSLTRWSPHTWLRVVAPLWPVAMLFTILATANHFILDALVGASVSVMAFLVSDVMLVFRPVEEWAFWVFRTEKPGTNDSDPPEVKRWGSVWSQSWK